MRSRRIPALVLSALLVCGLGACGDDDEDAADDASSVVDESTGADSGDAADDSDAADDGDKSEEEASGADEGGMPEVSDDCTAAAAVAAAIGLSAVSGDQAAEALEQASKNVPEEIADDVQVLVDALKEQAASAGVDISNPEDLSPEDIQAYIEQATAVLDRPEVQEAQRNFESYFSEHCSAG